MDIKIKKNTSNSRGFVLIVMLAIMPMLIAFVFLSMALLFLVKSRTQAYWMCYTIGAQIQNELEKKLSNLLSLNPEADGLRKERKLAKQMYKEALLSGSPPIIKAALLYLKSVKLRQKILKFQQKSIIKKSKALVENLWKKFKNKSHSLFISLTKMKKYNPFPVKSKPKKSDSPSYYLLKDFSKKQKISIFWKMDELSLLPSALKEKYNLNKIASHYCSVSLKDKDNQFKVILMN